MGAYTETYIKVDRLTHEQVESVVRIGLMRANSDFNYRRVKEEGFDAALKHWLDVHNKNYNYFVNECNVNPAKLDETYLKKEFRKLINKIEKKIEGLNNVLKGKITLEEFLKTYKEHKRWGDLVNVLKFNGNWYIDTHHEIFRNCEYDQLSINLHTVDDLISHLKKPYLNGIKDLTDPDSKYGPLTPELENKIRAYYGEIGDNNFVVNFG